MRIEMTRNSLFVIFLLVSLSSQEQVNKDLRQFVSRLDSIRVALKIPAMSMALMERDSILFEGGFGYADLKNHIGATANTSYRIASITKTFTSTLIMQLVEQRKLRLETPVSAYGIDLGNDRITVKNLLTHTSEEDPGTHFQYNGFRFGKLGGVIEKAGGLPFFQVLMENIIKPLKMSSTAPGDSVAHYFPYLQQRKDMISFFETAHFRLAKPYELNEKGEIMESNYLNEFGAFGGLVSTVTDLLKYSAAIDRHQLVNANTQHQIFKPNRTKDGRITPYGYGWFAQQYRGINFYWHYGQTQGESGLFIKVPSKKMTLVVLTNIDKLSQPFPLGDGDLFTSPVGQLFYKYCINKDNDLRLIDYNLSIPNIREALSGSAKGPYKDFYNKELISQAAICMVRGDSGKAKALYQLYADLNFERSLALHKEPVIAEIRDVAINQDISKIFTLSKPTRVGIYGVGENCSGDFRSWCDYGWIEDSTGKMFWQMQGQPASPAGGALKNQRVVAVITLPAGSYKLRYKSDAGHAYNNWDSAPPDNFFWGILLFGYK